MEGKLVVKNSSGEQVQMVNFNGQVAEFERLEMHPGETYNFYMFGNATLRNNSCVIKENGWITGNPCVIKENGLISGKMEHDFQYWI